MKRQEGGPAAEPSVPCSVWAHTHTHTHTTTQKRAVWVRTCFVGIECLFFHHTSNPCSLTPPENHPLKPTTNLKSLLIANPVSRSPSGTYFYLAYWEKRDCVLACTSFSGKQKGKQRVPSTLRFRKFPGKTEGVWCSIRSFPESESWSGAKSEAKLRKSARYPGGRRVFSRYTRGFPGIPAKYPVFCRFG